MREFRSKIIISQILSHRKVLHQFALGCSAFEHFAYGGEELVGRIAVALDALVFPMGSQAAFGNLVHAFGAYLYLYPAVARAIDGDMEGFVAI